MPDEIQQEILRNYNFVLEMGSERAGWFTNIRNHGVEVSCIDYREGGRPNWIRKLPGQTTIAPIICEWGMTRSQMMWDWLMGAAEGRVIYKEVSIVVVDPADGQTEKARFDYSGVWPSAWSGTEFDAGGNDIAIECMTLQAESIRRVQPGQRSS